MEPSLLTVRLDGLPVTVTALGERLLQRGPRDPEHWLPMTFTAVEQPTGWQLVRFGAKLARVGRRDWRMVPRAQAGGRDVFRLAPAGAPGTWADPSAPDLVVCVERVDAAAHDYLNQPQGQYPYGAQQPWTGEGLVRAGDRVRLDGPGAGWWEVERPAALSPAVPGFRLVRREAELLGFGPDGGELTARRGQGVRLGFLFVGRRQPDGRFAMHVYDAASRRGRGALVEVEPRVADELLGAAALPAEPLWVDGTGSAEVYLVRAHDGLVLGRADPGASLALGGHAAGLRLVAAADGRLSEAGGARRPLTLEPGTAALALGGAGSPLAWAGDLVVAGTGDRVRSHYRARRDGWRLLAATRGEAEDVAAAALAAAAARRRRLNARRRASTVHRRQMETGREFVGGAFALAAALVLFGSRRK